MVTSEAASMASRLLGGNADEIAATRILTVFTAFKGCNWCDVSRCSSSDVKSQTCVVAMQGAADYGLLEIVRLLIEQGVDVKSETGVVALQKAEYAC